LAERLGRDYGVAVRSGLFCAHPFVSHLLRTPAATAVAALRARTAEEAQLPGAVRASIGIGVQPGHVDRLISALLDLQKE
jgi:selenocysteine lyase/cysteine desulfurase